MMKCLKLGLRIHLSLFFSIIWDLYIHTVKLVLDLILVTSFIRRIWPFSSVFNKVNKLLGLGTVKVEKTDLTGKVCIVTGGASGIGKRVSRFFVECGATVIIADKSENKGRVAAYKINTIKRAGSLGYARFMYVDLQTEDSIRSFVARFTYDYDRLDILVNNAGICSDSESSCSRSDLPSISRIFQVNYIGTFLLTEFLLPTLKSTKDSRIVNTCSPIHRFFGSNVRKIIEFSEVRGGYSAYGASKAAILLYTLKLRRDAMGLTFCQTLRKSESGTQGHLHFPWSTCVNPGSVYTNIYPHRFRFIATRLFFKWLLLDTEQVSLTDSNQNLFFTTSLLSPTCDKFREQKPLFSPQSAQRSRLLFT
ncbi:SDR family NAD(P)-dependent oxidoreductase [Cryptosporidium felis]|nr:SDR family NAD(P)-dependent oxidoreductase [Cryptosporidium felis]